MGHQHRAGLVIWCSAGTRCSGEPADRYDRNAGNDDYTQAGNLYRLMTPGQRERLVAKVVGSMSGIAGEQREAIVNRQLCHFFRADPAFGAGVAMGPGVDVDAVMNATAHSG